MNNEKEQRKPEQDHKTTNFRAIICIMAELNKVPSFAGPVVISIEFYDYSIEGRFYTGKKKPNASTSYSSFPQPEISLSTHAHLLLRRGKSFITQTKMDDKSPCTIKWTRRKKTVRPVT